jgi:hypothetical protein
MLQNERLVWIGHRKDPSILLRVLRQSAHRLKWLSAFEILFEIPPVPRFRSSCYFAAGTYTNFGNKKGHGQVFDASAAFRFGVPVANLQQAVQELQIGGAGRQAYSIFDAFS